MRRAMELQQQAERKLTHCACGELLHVAIHGKEIRFCPKCTPKPQFKCHKCGGMECEFVFITIPAVPTRHVVGFDRCMHPKYCPQCGSARLNRLFAEGNSVAFYVACELCDHSFQPDPKVAK